MRKLIFILLFVSCGLTAQVTGRYSFAVTPSTGCTEIGAESRWFFENNGDDEESNNALTATGGATYDSNGQPQGSYYGDLGGNGRYFAVPSINYGNAFTIIFEIYVGAASTRTLYGAMDSNDGFQITIDCDGDDILFLTGNGSDTNHAVAYDCSIPESSWAMVAVVVNRTAGTAVIYLNGVDVTDDNTIRTDFDNETVARVGWTLAGGYAYWGEVDAGQLYLWGLTSDDISTINTTPGTEVTTCE